MAEAAESRSQRSIGFLAALPNARWFAYGAVLLVQARAMWGIWDKDLTGGDTSYYYTTSELWSNDLMVNFAWSPLYTSYLGTVDWLTGSVVDAVLIHRVVVVFALAVLVLAVLRRLVPAWAALVGACWWASLPIIYDSLYTVHLFAALPLLFAVWLLTDEPSATRRGAAIGFLLAAAILVRNEAGFVAVLLIAATVAAEWRARRRGNGLPLKRLAIAFGVPVVVALGVIGLTFERSAVKGELLSSKLEDKHTLNVCQVYTFSYQQRHPGDFTGSPWTECQDFMVTVFGEPQPSLTEAWRREPGKMLDFTTWNMRLLPQGVQVALFNAAVGNLNPDYVRTTQLGAWWAGVLAVLLAGIVVAGAVYLRHDWQIWGPKIGRQRWAWIALAAITVVILGVIVFTQRPRPSYMFGMTAAIVAIAMLAVAVLARRFGLERWAATAAALLPAVLMVALPIHYRDRPTPLADGVERAVTALDVEPAGESGEVLVAPLGYGGDMCRYLAPNEPCTGLRYIAPSPEQSLREALDARGATVFYADETISSDPGVAEFLDQHRGWEVVDSGSSENGRWAVLERRGS